MRIAIIYAGEKVPTNEWLERLLSESGTVTAICDRDLKEWLAGNNSPEAICCEYSQPESFSAIVTELSHHFPQVPLFSFGSPTAPPSQSLLTELGLVAHLGEPLTVSELNLHLHYGQRLMPSASRRHHRITVEQALTGVTALHFYLESAQVIEAALANLPRLIPGDSLALYLSTAEQESLELVGQLNAPHAPALLLLSEKNQQHPLVQAASSGKASLIADATQELAKLGTSYYPADSFNSLMCLPLCTRARLFGVLEISTAPNGARFTAEDLRLAEKVAEALAVALANASNYTNVERLGQIDDLTQLYNSRHLYQVLEAEMKRSRRYKIPVSVIFLDLDGFKLVNDTNGHLCGSATLTEVANLMIALVRETDIVARYGGDEFVIVLPETPAERAVTIAERIRQQIEGHVFRGGGDSEIYLTASFGVAAYPEHASSPAALIRSADKAMYMAKECNKNQVVLAN